MSPATTLDLHLQGLCIWWSACRAVVPQLASNVLLILIAFVTFIIVPVPPMGAMNVSTRGRDVLLGLGICTACGIALKAAYASWKWSNLMFGPVHVRKYKWRFALVTGGQLLLLLLLLLTGESRLPT
jgi:hypothetical protein